MNGFSHKVQTLVKHLAVGRFQVTTQKVKESGFSGTIGPDDGVQCSGLDLYTDIVHRSQAAKVLAQVSGFNNCFS